jgi:hypothetical protein
MPPERHGRNESDLVPERPKRRADATSFASNKFRADAALAHRFAIDFVGGGELVNTAACSWLRCLEDLVSPQAVELEPYPRKS